MSNIEGRDRKGGGSLNQTAVNKKSQLEAFSIVESELAEALEDGRGFIFYSTYSATGGQEVWFLQNDGDDIHLDRLIISTSATGIFTIMRQTSGTATGTTMNGRNGVVGSAVMPDVTALGNAEVAGCVDGDAIDGHDIGTTAPFIFALEGMVIPRTEAIFVRAEVTGVIHVVGLCHRLE